MLKIAVLIVVLLIVALLIYAATKAAVFRVQRSTGIQASAAIFPMLNDFHRWGVWSHYEKLDPGMKRIYSGESLGKGAVYAWDGNSKAGEGAWKLRIPCHLKGFSFAGLCQTIYGAQSCGFHDRTIR